jgi:hypothetical protein
MVFLFGECNEVVIDVSTSDLEDRKLNVKVSDSFDVSISDWN